MRVWDPLVRLLHWALVAAFVVAWFSHGGYLSLHRISGYLVGALVAVRVAWGFAGPARARFSDFVVGPAKLAAYLGLMVRAREPRYVGHNPAGGAMIVVLLLLLAGVCATGLLLDTPRLRDSGFKEVHDLLTDATVACIVLHVAGVAYASWRHRENLVLSMISGRKRSPHSSSG